MDEGDSHCALSLHISRLVERALRSIEGENKLDRQIELCNAILKLILNQHQNPPFNEEAMIFENKQLFSLEKRSPLLTVSRVARPDSPLSQGCLLTGNRLDPSLASQLQKEIASSDEVEILCSFIRWSGIRILCDALEAFTARPDTTLRVITTSYMGATDPKAVDFLCALPNTEIKVSYDTHRTRLHAKAYLFRRNTGFGTAYIGSANLSRAALTEGLEWTLKISQVEQAYLFDRLLATFEAYWNDREFVTYTPDQRQVLIGALSAERQSELDEGEMVFFDLEPFAFQREILEKLDAERQLHGRSRQLVVAATGTGKTMIAAFDYKRWRQQQLASNPRSSVRLLFVAHREEILRQSLMSFRHVLRDANFGDLMVGGHEPQVMDHLFVSIQTWNSRQLAKQIPPDYYDYVIVDEFHHAAAVSYRDLLHSIHPKILLGLTATPERADGLDVLSFFDGHVSAEVRLPDAIDRRLLSPFQYFCIADNEDLSGLRWQRGGYVKEDLDKVYTGNDRRAELVIQKVHQILSSVRAARGLGFCVSQTHAHYMSRKFNEANIPSAALDAETPATIRREVQDRLRRREINFIFVVDLYNEGVDIPEDTIFFLRPTESLTVFLQQLGRGLRLSADKECLTVLDFIGHAHRNFRFDARFRSLLGRGHHRIAREIEEGFPHLPAGCSIYMERVAREHILENVRQSLQMARTQLVLRVRNFESETGRVLTLPAFLDYYDLSLDDLYRNWTWSRLLSDAGIGPRLEDPDERVLTRGLRRIQHINDPEYIRRLQRLLKLSPQEAVARAGQMDQRRLLMMHLSLWEQDWTPSSLVESLERFNRNPILKQEFLDLLAMQLESVGSVAPDVKLPFLCPLHLHALYSRDEILAALGYWTLQARPQMREGVKYLPNLPADLLFVTLNKTEDHYSPTTMYEDYAISDTLFHWQSQNTTPEDSPTGRRYIHHRECGHTILLFVREDRRRNGLACPYHFLGPVSYVSHTGSRPMSIVWRLQYPMPAHLQREATRVRALKW